MGIHAFTEYLKYRWKAKGRHGTHSPFVYALVEDVLQGNVAGNGLIVEYFSENNYGRLLSRIAAYYNYDSLLDLNVGFDIPGATLIHLRLPSKGDLDIVVLPEKQPEKWGHLLHKYISVVEDSGMIIVPAIHKTKLHTESWDKLRADTSAKLSIDIYGIGLLFSKMEFKEKQHFILKY